MHGSFDNFLVNENYNPDAPESFQLNLMREQDLEQMKKLREVIITGCCTDICVMNLAIPLQNYFDQHDLDTTIYVPKDLVETYDSPTHNRDEYNEMAFRLMENTGIKLVKKIGGNYGKYYSKY